MGEQSAIHSCSGEYSAFMEREFGSLPPHGGSLRMLRLVKQASQCVITLNEGPEQSES